MPWRRDRLPTPVFSGFPCGSAGKESTCNAGDLNLIPGLGRSTGEGKGYPLQYSQASLVAQLVRNLPAMRETWVRFLGREDPMEKGKAARSIFWPGEFQGLHSSWGRKESDTTEQLSLFTFTPRLADNTCQDLSLRVMGNSQVSGVSETR